MTIIDTPHGINHFRLLAIKHGLALELKGLKHSRNAVFQAAKQLTGMKTRQACYDAVCGLVEQSLASKPS